MTIYDTLVGFFFRGYLAYMEAKNFHAQTRDGRGGSYMEALGSCSSPSLTSRLLWQLCPLWCTGKCPGALPTSGDAQASQGEYQDTQVRVRQAASIFRCTKKVASGPLPVDHLSQTSGTSRVCERIWRRDWERVCSGESWSLAMLSTRHVLQPQACWGQLKENGVESFKLFIVSWKCC